MAPDETLIANATYIVTQADANVGTITNTAEVSGVNVRNTQQSVTDQDSVTVSLPHNPSLVFDKTSSYTAGDEGSTVGDEIEYSFTIENTGNVTLTDVAITDDKVGDITYTWPEGNAPGTLNPGETTTATAVYVLTQDDVDASQVVNTASVTGTPPPGGDHEPPVETDTDITPVVQAPQIDIVKTVSEANERSVVGDKLTYTFTITNTGNVTLSDVILTDPLPNLDFGSPIPPTKDSLAPGETWTVTAELTLLQSHIDIGSVENTAFTSGEPPAVPDGTLPARVSDTDAADVTLGQQPEVELTKSVSEPSNPAVEGEVLTYTFEVVNTGNVTLTGVFISDPLQGLSAITYDWPGTQPGVLAPGETVTATATYAVILADIESGSIDNTAMAAGRTLSGVNVSDEDSASVELQENPVISLFKDDSYTPTGPDGTAQAGDIVTYTFTITNVGNVTLDPITLVDDHDVVWAEDMDVADLGPLAPEEEAIVTATYVLTQEDIDAGEIVNSATATGSSPIGTEVTSESSVPTRLNQAPGIELTKDASYDVDGPASVGEPIAYNFVITNTGNVTLTGIELADQLEGISEIAFGQWPGAENTLAPGQSVVANATYNLTQEDINAGIVTNDASVIGHPPSGDPVSDDASVDTPVDRASDISIVKTNVFDGVGRVGETIEYSIVVTNTGNQTLTNVVVTDDLEGLTWAEDSDPVIGTMQPGESVILEATYTLTQDDVNTGRVVNTASVTGDDPTDTPVNDDDSTTTEVNGEPGISLVKTNSLDGDAVAGSVITYTFEVTNTGDTTLANVHVTDPLPGLTWAEDSDPAVGTMQPGESVTLEATYTLTQDDVNAGGVTNVATVSGDDPSGTPVEDEGTTTTPIPSQPAISLEKTHITGESGAVGEIITYNFTVTNTGNVTLDSVVVVDDHAGLVWVDDPQVGTLQPGDTVTLTATYAVTQDDLDAGFVYNEATVTGTPPTGDPVTSTDDTETPWPPVGAIQIVTNGELDQSRPTVPGDLAIFTFSITNIDNVTLRDVTLETDLEGLEIIDTKEPDPSQPGVLLPGESMLVTAQYPLTQADIDQRVVEVTGTAIGQTPLGDRVIDIDPAAVTPVFGDDLVFVKSADFDRSENSQPGDITPTPSP